MEGAGRVILASNDTLRLGTKVILGTVDVAAVGARVLLALEPPSGWTVREAPLDIQGLQPPQPPAPSQQRQQPAGSPDPDGGAGRPRDGDEGDTLRPVLAVPGADPARDSGAMDVGSSSSGSAAPGSAAVALLRNFYSPGQEEAADAPEISLLVLNTVIPEGAQAEVAAALLDLVEGRGAAAAAAGGTSGGSDAAAACAGPAAAAAAAAAPGPDGRTLPAVAVVAALLLQQMAQPAGLYEHVLNGAAPLDAALPPLRPPAAAAVTHGSAIRVRDGQLAALLHVLQVSGTAACCLVTPGHKPPASTPLDLPGSLPACDAIGAALAAAYGLRYDAEKCRAIRALYKWFVPGKTAGSDVMYL